MSQAIRFNDVVFVYEESSCLATTEGFYLIVYFMKDAFGVVNELNPGMMNLIIIVTIPINCISDFVSCFYCGYFHPLTVKCDYDEILSMELEKPFDSMNL